MISDWSLSNDVMAHVTRGGFSKHLCHVIKYEGVTESSKYCQTNEYKIDIISLCTDRNNCSKHFEATII
jgi:hypothetical protein